MLFLLAAKGLGRDEVSVELLEAFEAWRRGLGVVAVWFPFRDDRTWWLDILACASCSSREIAQLQYSQSFKS